MIVLLCVQIGLILYFLTGPLSWAGISGAIWFVWPILAAIALYGLYGIMMLIAMNVKRHELRLQPDGLVLFGRHIRADEVERVYVKGYFMQTAAIKLRGARVINHSRCFRFKEREDEAMAQIRDWAASHNIPIQQKAFNVWV